MKYDPDFLKILQEDTWKNDKDFEKTCVRKRRADKTIQHPLYGTWVADFMLRWDEGRFIPGKYLSNKQVPWKRRRRLRMAVAGFHTNRELAEKNRQAANSRMQTLQTSAGVLRRKYSRTAE